MMSAVKIVSDRAAGHELNRKATLSRRRWYLYLYQRSRASSACMLKLERAPARHRHRKDSMKAQSIQARDRRSRAICPPRDYGLIVMYQG